MSGEDGHLIDSYADGCSFIEVLGVPRVSSRMVTELDVRYMCNADMGDIQIGARVTGSTVHSNRFGRFAYPSTPATADGRVRTSTLALSAMATASPTAFADGEIVTVEVDLLTYVGATAATPGSVTPVAGIRMQAGIRYTAEDRD